MTYFWEDLKRFDQSPAVVMNGGETISYNELDRRADAFATQIGNKAELVLLHVDRSIGFLAAYLGVLRHGSTAILCENGNEELARVLRETYNPSREAKPLGSDYWQLKTLGVGPKLHPDLALLISTSGSSGTAKAVRQSRNNLQSNAEAIATYLKIDPQDRAPTLLPLHYCYGLSVVHSHLLMGATILLGKFSATSPNFLSQMKQMGATSLAGVPYTFELLERAGMRQADLPTIRTVTQAGGRLDREKVALFAEWAEQTNRNFYVMYGSTEATSRMTYLPPDMALSLPESIGIPIPGGSVDLVDEKGVSVPDGEEGELVYRGPNVMLGYATGPDDLARGPEVDALKTGDLARRLDGGFLEITGRKSRFSKIYGQRLNLDKVSSDLAEEFGILAHVVSDDKRLFVRTTEKVPEAEIAMFIATRFQLLPDRIDVGRVETLPLLPSGKIDLRALLLEVVAKDPDASGLDPVQANPVDDLTRALTEQETKIAELWKRIVGDVSVTPSSSFYDAGGDSLSGLQVGLLMEREGVPRAAVSATFEGRSLHEVSLHLALDVASAQTQSSELQRTQKLPAATAISWSLTMARAIVAIGILFAHWGPGAINALNLPDQLGTILRLYFRFGTPGFATAFGLGVGLYMLPAMQESPGAVLYRARRAFWLVISGVVLLALVKLYLSYTKSEPFGGLTFSNAIYNVLLYYALMLLTAPIWLRALARIRDVTTFLIIAAPVLWLLWPTARAILTADQQSSLLELPRLMLVAGYSIFKLGALTAAGAAMGYWISQQADQNKIRHRLLLIGGVGMFFCLATLFQTSGFGILRQNSSVYVSLPGLAFYGCAVFFIMGVSISILPWWRARGVVGQVILRLFLTCGGLALPLYVFHQFVFPLRDILKLGGLESSVALALPMAGFFIVITILGRRIYRMYGTGSTGLGKK